MSQPYPQQYGDPRSGGQPYGGQPFGGQVYDVEGNPIDATQAGHGVPDRTAGGPLKGLFSDEQALWLVVVAALGVALGLLVLIRIFRQFLYIARPNQALIFSGKTYVGPNGEKVGYRIVTQGRRAFRVPLIERVDHMDMRLIPIDVVVQNAYSAGNIPLQIHAIANVKLHGDPRFLPNAVERFLGRSRNEVQAVAQQTLEGALREVIARLTPEEVNEDRLKFAEKLRHSAEEDLNKLGLQLDTLKIQHVSDETGYLDSLGRPRIAAALAMAEQAESQALQETTQAQAAATRRAEVAKEQAEAAVAQHRNELRRVLAELEGQAQSVEREAEAAARTARAEAEQQLQAIRAELEQRRLAADVVIPAEIERAARAILAKGEAAPTAENGAAAVEVLRAMSEAWAQMGAQAKELYVIQHLEEIVGAVVSQLRGMDVSEVNVIDPGDGSGMASYAATYPKMVASVMKALAETTGVDVPGVLAGGSGAAGASQGSAPGRLAGGA
jgi:flotillin